MTKEIGGGLNTYTYYNNGYQELYHFGIKGMKWGIRRYQNEDGSLTEAGKKRYELDQKMEAIAKNRYANKYDKQIAKEYLESRNGESEAAKNFRKSGYAYGLMFGGLNAAMTRRPITAGVRLAEGAIAGHVGARASTRYYNKRAKSVGERYDSTGKLKTGIKYGRNDKTIERMRQPIDAAAPVAAFLGTYAASRLGSMYAERSLRRFAASRRR